MAKTGKIIRLVRKSSGDTQEALGKSLGVTKAYLSMVENDRSVLRMDKLVDFCDRYGVGLSVLFWLSESDGDSGWVASLVDIVLGHRYGVRIIRVNGVVERVEKV